MSDNARNRAHMKRVKKKTLDFMSRSIIEYLNDISPKSDPLAVTTSLAAMQACLVEAYSEHLGEVDAAMFYYGIADDLAIKSPPVISLETLKRLNKPKKDKDN